MSDAHELLAADSFRVRGRGEEAAVRGFERHLARFAGAASAGWHENVPVADPDAIAAKIAAFIAASRERIAAAGDGFPRLELWRFPGEREPRLKLALRPLPPLAPTLALSSAPGGPLPHAERKGPNIAAYASLRRELLSEPLLLDSAERVLEGATTSLIWWDRTTGVGAVSALPDRVPSITEALIRDATQLEPRVVTLAQLTEHEIWAVNALHGIRQVTHIDGVSCPEPDMTRLARVQRMLDRCWEPVRVAAARN